MRFARSDSCLMPGKCTKNARIRKRARKREAPSRCRVLVGAGRDFHKSIVEYICCANGNASRSGRRECKNCSTCMTDFTCATWRTMRLTATSLHGADRRARTPRITDTKCSRVRKNRRKKRWTTARTPNPLRRSSSSYRRASQEHPLALLECSLIGWLAEHGPDGVCSSPEDVEDVPHPVLDVVRRVRRRRHVRTRTLVLQFQTSEPSDSVIPREGSSAPNGTAWIRFHMRPGPGNQGGRG